MSDLTNKIQVVALTGKETTIYVINDTLFRFDKVTFDWSN